LFASKLPFFIRVLQKVFLFVVPETVSAFLQKCSAALHQLYPAAG
jgi:hypothetical protein